MRYKPNTAGWLTVLPLGICLILVTTVPLCYVFILGLFRYYLPEKTQTFIGLLNYAEILRTAEFWHSFSVTIVFCGGVIFFHLVLGLGIALLLNQRFLGLEKVKRIFRTIIVIPWLIAGAVSASIWLVIFHPFGAINTMLMSSHLLQRPIIWLGDNRFPLPTVMALYIWRNLPFYIIIILAAIESIPQQLYEAASIDGAGKINQFLYITLSYVTPTLLTLGMIDTIWSFVQFDLIFLTTGGGPAGATQNLSLLTYYTAFEDLRFGKASTQGILTFLFSLVFVIIYIKLSVQREK
jgi:multiple sugar transport system permease protein